MSPTTPTGTIVESPFETSTGVTKRTKTKRSPSSESALREKRRSAAERRLADNASVSTEDTTYARFEIGDGESEDGGIRKRRDAIKRPAKKPAEGDEEEQANDADDELETEEEDRETRAETDEDTLTDSEFTLAKDYIGPEIPEELDEHEVVASYDEGREVHVGQECDEDTRQGDDDEISKGQVTPSGVSPEPTMPSGDSSLNDDSVENDESVATIVELSRDKSEYEDLSGVKDGENTTDDGDLDLTPSQEEIQSEELGEAKDEANSPGDRSLYDNVEFCDDTENSAPVKSIEEEQVDVETRTVAE